MSYLSKNVHLQKIDVGSQAICGSVNEPYILVYQDDTVSSVEKRAFNSHSIESLCSDCLEIFGGSDWFVERIKKLGVKI